MAERQKYYWLKLKRDFFKRHDMRIVEGMQNGKDYVLFYLKMLVESIDHNGKLRFNETIPYNEQMLSVITNTNIDIVRSAMKLFIELQMIEVLDDATIYMIEVQKLTGTETIWAEKKRLYRGKENAKRTLSLPCPTVVRQEKELEKEIELEKKSTGTKRFKAPCADEVKAYCTERKNHVDADKFIDYYTANGWKVGKNPMKDWKAAIRTWEKNSISSGKKNNFQSYDQGETGEEQIYTGPDLLKEAREKRNA